MVLVLNLRPSPPHKSSAWKDNSGIVYHYGQKAQKIWWRAPSIGIYGSGTINGDRVTTVIYYEQTQKFVCQVSGTVKDIDSYGLAQRIEWEDWNAFKR